MAIVKTKDGVRFDLVTRALVRMLGAMVLVAEKLDEPSEIVITSGSDGTHAKNSHHYRGSAIDIRTKNFPSPTAIQRFASALRHELGPAFTVLYEGAGTPSQHLHCQLQKGSGPYEGPV